MKFRALFLQHPESVGESYWQHMRTALRFAGELLKAAAAVVVHSLVPGLFQNTASSLVTRLHQRMTVERGRTGKS